MFPTDLCQRLLEHTQQTTDSNWAIEDYIVATDDETEKAGTLKKLTLKE